MDARDRRYLWCFARVLAIYPRAFRGRFGAAMIQAFSDGLRDRRMRHGAVGAATFAVRALLNHVASGLAERRYEARRHAPARRRGLFRPAVQDLRFAVRMMRRQRGVALLAIVTLAIGLGATTTVFSLVDASLLRPVALPDPGRLVVALETTPTGSPSQVSYDNALDWARETRSFAGMAGFRGQSVNLTGLDAPAQVRGGFVTGQFFDVAGVAPAIGRVLRAEDDAANAPPVVVINHGIWQRHFGGRADILNQTVRLNNIAFTVVGVMPDGFYFPFDGANVWMPARLMPSTRSRSARTMVAFGRLRQDVTIEQARAELSAIARALAVAHPEANEGRGATVDPLHRWLTSDVRDRLTLVLGLVFVLLAAACANVTSLQVAATAARRTEIAIRVALGAGRPRIMRQLFTEHLLLAAAGGGLGVLLANVLLPAAVAAAPTGIFGLHRAALDSRVLLFAGVLTLLAGLASGLIPAWHWAGQMPSTMLAGTGRMVGDRRLARAHVWLVGGQVAMAAVLLTIGGLLVKSYAAMTAIEPGFTADGVYTLEYRLPANKYPPADQMRFHQAVVARVSSVPGVIAAAGVRALPFSGNGDFASYRTDRMAADAEPAAAELNTITSDYFRVMGIPLIRGRTFDQRDHAQAPMTVVVSRSFAEREWPDTDPIGRVIMPVGEPITAQVIGVVGDVRHRTLVDESLAACYVHNAQNPGIFMTLAVKAAGDMDALAPAIRRAVWDVDPDQPVWKERSLESLVRASVQSDRFLSSVLGVFSTASLVLVVSGLYGVVSQAVSRRSREIGVRMALGATRAVVLGDVLMSGIRMIAAGLVAGLAVSMWIARWLESELYQTSPLDTAPYTVTAVLLIVVALAACYLPARRAAALTPSAALRR